jgi:site-specific DNA-cytosine methylase
MGLPSFCVWSIEMKVLSLFDGMSSGQLALNRIGIKPEIYYSAEIDKYAIKVTQANYPSTIQLGDVTKWREWKIDWASIDLVIGGSPCQSISNLGDGTGLKGKSGLFYTFLDILDHIKSKNKNVKFLLENVEGKRDSLDEMSRLLGVNYKKFNSNLLSAQNRSRVYWTNFIFELPSDKGLVLLDILERGLPKDSILSPGRMRWLTSTKGAESIKKRYTSIDPIKAACLTSRSDASWNSNYVTRNGILTRLTPTEYERLQTVFQYIKTVEVVLCSDQAKNFVTAVEKNPKLLKLVSSAENSELQVVNTLVNQKSVFIDITEGKITHYGREVSHQIEQNYTEQMSGKIALSLCGNEMVQSAKDVLSALEMMQTNQYSTSITSFRLSTKNLEQILTISYWFAKSVTDGFTYDTIKTRSLYLNLIDGYTAHVSNSQRYKMLGNGWTVDVISHILSHIKEDLK